MSEQSIREEYLVLIKDPTFWRRLVFSAILFLVSIVANFYANSFATERASNHVADLVLSNIPVWDIDFIFVWGAIFLLIFVTILCLLEPRTIPFTLLAMGSFYLIRAGFVTLTHIAPYPDHVSVEGGYLIERFFGADDLFFSGHTGAPFMMALVYWRHIFLRYMFLSWSVLMGIVVLLGHLHYTIDVISAFFITYGILHIVEWLFPKERKIFYGDTP